KLFTMPPSAMYRRPARDRNYEFWGDQPFFGENPPPAAIISWVMKRPSNDVKLKIADGTGREVRVISGQVLANSGKPGIQSACWDLRVNPNPAPPAEGRGRGAGEGGREGAAAPAGGSASTSPPRPTMFAGFGAGCGIETGTGAGGVFAAGGSNLGPFVYGGTYNVALVVDGKTVDTKPLRVVDDPEVVLTSVERRKMYDMAMEVHALQPAITDAAAAHASLTRQVNEIAPTLASKTDI